MTRFGQGPVLAYDYDKVIDKLVADGMTPEEAVEYHDFNQAGAWVGKGTPCFVQQGSYSDLEEMGVFDGDDDGEETVPAG